MDDPQHWAIRYLSPRNSPWRWADDGDVIAWTDGTTIIFREELAFILEWLIPHGWPPFGALIWLFAAGRGKLPPPLPAAELSLPIDIPPADEIEVRNAINLMHDRHAAVERGLAVIARLPAEVCASLKAKAVLAETVFGETGEQTPQTLRQSVVALLRSGALTDTMLNNPGAPPPDGRGEFAALQEGLRGLAPESLALRLRTGLDVLPRAALIPVPLAARVRAMLAELRSYPEHAGLARLVRDFMAAVQLPRLLSESDEMPVGGFADLSNRGNLDRLLLSELAHDDLTLAVRIALQEALYLRREPPAKQPPSTLAVLLDAGVRLWGVPRLLATAVGLALIGKSAQHEKLSVFRASGDKLAEVDLLSREGLTAHLGALETHAHPGAALPAFRRALEDSARHDAVLITQRDVVHDPAFRRSLAAANFDTLYLAVVDRDGSFELLRAPHLSAPLCRAQVKVDDLLPAPSSPTERRTVLIDPTANPDLPLIYSATPFPLLISIRGKVQRAVEAADGGGLCVLDDRRLLHWRKHTRGARTVATGLPQGRTLWLGELADGAIGVASVQGRSRQVTCQLFAADGDRLCSHCWHLDAPLVRAEEYRGLLCIICRQVACFYHPRSGRHLGSIEVRDPSHGRYFLTNDGWCILIWDGQAVRLDPVHFPLPMLPGSVLRVWNRRGHEGPWCLTRDGDILTGEGALALQLGPLNDFTSISGDGETLVVSAKNGKAETVDLSRMDRLTGASWRGAPGWPIAHLPSAAMRTHFAEIGVTSGSLQLISRKGAARHLGVRDEKLVLSKGPLALAADRVRFESTKTKAVGGVSMAVARWPDGRSAWLDGNRMLHLRGADRSQPEVTIVLCRGPLAAWTSDGLWHGPEFFIGDRESSPASELWARILACTQ